LKRDGNKTTLRRAFDLLHEQVQNEVREDHAINQTPILNSQWNGNDIVISAPPTQPRLLPESVKQLLGPDSSSNAPGTASTTR
jgi:hypothetical protein